MLKHYKSDKQVVGCDEAGRGCLAGPVFAAAVILPKGFSHPLLNDSKKLSENQRNSLEPIIKSEAIEWAVQKCTPKEIDKYNILWASFRAMHKAINKLESTPDLILVDGNRFKPYKTIPHDCVIGGDAIYLSIAAASILAKNARDRYMVRLAKKFPDYGWEQNKGYPTSFHRDAIINCGPCKHHRQSFRLYPLPEQGSLF